MAPPEKVTSLEWCGKPVTLWRWPDTGFSVLLCESGGPITHGYFAIATEAHDDDGLPHTLEHLIFLGSEDFPYKGVLDTAANRLFARGTNAWTATDHTAYTASHAGAEGLLRLLPVYADHVFFPTITESGYATEVHHVNGEGVDGGVVYCEMEARENTSYSISSYELGQLLFAGSGYESETGGRLHELRNSCSHAKVAAYHRAFYNPRGVRLVVSGAINPDQLLAALEPVNAKILTKGADFWPPPTARPWSAPVPRLSASVSREVRFPADDESTGIVRVGWLTYDISEAYKRAALSALLTYLSSTSVSELQRAFVECDPPLAGAVYANSDEYRLSAAYITFDSVPTERIGEVLARLDATLSAFVADPQGGALDMPRLRSVLHRRRLDILDAAEEAPEEAMAGAAIPAFLYADEKSGDAASLAEALGELERVAKMEGEDPSFWIKMAAEALVEAHRAVVLGRPSAQLGKEAAEAELARIAAQRAAMGEAGLKAAGEALAAAIAANEKPPPPEMLSTAFPLPEVDSISLHTVTSLRSATVPVAAGEHAPPPPPPQHAALAAEVAALPFPAQFDITSSAFVDITLALRTDGLSRELRTLLPLFVSLLLESPLRKPDGTLQPHDEVVALLTATTLSCGASCGWGGGRFNAGAFGEGMLLINCRAEAGKYQDAARLLSDCLLHGELAEPRVRTQAQKALNAVPRAARDGGGCAAALLRSRTFQPDSAARCFQFSTQQRRLNSLVAALDADAAAAMAPLAQLRSALLAQPGRLLLHVSGAMQSDAAQVWAQCLAPGLAACASAEAAALPGRVQMASTCLSPEGSEGGWARCMGNSAVDSGFLSSTLALPQLAAHGSPWEHPDVASLSVAIELLVQLEGPFWKLLRGAGLAYSYSISLFPETCEISFSLFKATAVAKAYAAAASIVRRYSEAEGEEAETLFAEATVETAIASSVFAALNRERTPASAARAALFSMLKGTGEGSNARFLAALRGVTPAQCRAALRSYISPLFDRAKVNVAVCVNSGKVDGVAEEMKCGALKTLEEAFPEVHVEECLLMRQKEAGPEAEAAALACACVRCVPKAGGPFSLPSARAA